MFKKLLKWVGWFAVALIVVRVGIALFSGGGNVATTSSGVEMSDDVARLNANWQVGVRWAIDQGMGLQDDIIYEGLEPFCKQWEWPKSRCKQAFADLLVTRERYSVEEKRREQAEKAHEKKLGYDD